MGIKFKILQENFQKALDAVGPAAANRTTINSLYGVLITAKDDVVILSATDLELRIDAKATAVITEAGQALVTYQTLHNQVRALPSEPVDVELIETENGEGQILSLTCGHASARLHCEDPTTFPPLQDNDRHTQAQIPTDALGRAIRMVSHCVATDDERPVLNCVALFTHPAEGTISTTAADGFRLAKMDLPCELEGEQDVAICIPRNSAREIERALGRHQGNAQLALDTSGSNARFAMADESLIITTQLLRQEVPPTYEDVIPQGPMTRNIVVNSAAFKSGINAVASMSQLGDSVTRMYVKDRTEEFPEGSIAFVANADGQFARNVVDVESYTPADAPLNYTAINHRYLVDFMNAIGNTSPIEIGIDDFTASIRLRNADESFVYIAMPMFVRWPNPNAPTEQDDHPPGDPGNQQPPDENADADEFADADATDDSDADDDSGAEE